MERESVDYRRWKRAALGAFLSLFSALTPAGAEPKTGRGILAITFHGSDVDRSKSEKFYVVKEGRDIRWQNFQERTEPDEKDPRKVYLLTESAPARPVSQDPTRQQTARR